MPSTVIWNGDAADNAFSTAGNFVGDAAATDNDSVTLPMMSADSTRDIDGSDETDTELGGFTIEKNCGIDIGSSATPLSIDMNDSTSLNLAGTGTTYLHVDNDVAGGVTALNVTQAGRGTGTAYGMNLKGAAVIATANIRASAGEVISLAANAGETGAYTTINVWGGTVYIGSGVTATTLNVFGGEVYCRASIATIFQSGGKLTLQKAVACSTSLTVQGGVCYEQSTGTKAAVHIADDGMVDATDCPAAPWTVVDIYGEGQLKDPNKKITFAGHITLNYAKMKQVDRGEHMNVTLAAVS